MQLGAGQRVIFKEFGETPVESIEKFSSLEPMDAPDPQALGDTEVIIQIKSASIAWADVLMTSGQYQHQPKPPYIPGNDYSGVVAGVGAGVDDSRCRVGDRVLIDFTLAGPRSLGPYQHAGGLASYAVVPQQAVLRIPGSLSFDQASNLLVNYETAYHCLVARGQLKSGETILINGATGSTGVAAVQVAKLLGATVIAVGRSDEKLALVKAQGADHVVNSSAPEGEGVRRFRDDVKALTGGNGVDVVYDAVGGETSLESMRCTAFGARFLIVGWASTPNVARGKGLRGSPNANQLPTNIMQMKGLSVLGCPTGIAVAKDPSVRPPRLAAVLRWADEGKIDPFVSNVYALSDYKKAMLARWNGEIVGGSAIHP